MGSHRLRPLFTTVVLAAGALPAVARAAQDAISPWQVATLRGVTSARMSPDGQHVAYVVLVPREPKLEDNGTARTELHVLDVASGRTRPYVTAESGVSSVRWTPDGSGIAFLAKRGDDDQRSLYVVPLDGGEARVAASLEDRGVGSYSFAPDGTRVAVVATAPESKGREAEKKAGFDQEVYEEDWRPAEVWIATLWDEDAEPRRLELDGHASAVEWSPRGDRLAVALAPTALVDDSYVRQHVWVVDVASGEARARVATRGKLGPFRWNREGTGLALIAGFDEFDGAAARLCWAPTEGAEGLITPQPMLGERERDETEVAWFAGERLVVLGSEGAWATLDAYRFVDGRAEERTPLVPLEGPIWNGVSFSEDGRRAALVGSTPEHGTELYTLDLASGSPDRRTNVNPWLASLRLARQEVVRYEARDGLPVEGILIHPLEASGPAPLLVVVHGGPEAHLSNGWLTGYAYPGQLAAARGYAVFHPNYRGSTGRGLAYLKSSQGDAAGKEFDDIVDGVDHLIARGLVDGDKVGITGGSYGGYATAWCSTYYSDRFAAGVMFVGISNKVSKVGTTDITDEEYYAHAHKRVWDDWQFFLERSPIYHADKSRTPLLILHGKEDPRVDPGQSREMYRHLKHRGQAPVRLVLYPGEGHGNRRTGARFDYNLRTLRWFDHYLMGPGGDPPDRTVDYDAYLPAEEEPAAPAPAEGL